MKPRQEICKHLAQEQKQSKHDRERIWYIKQEIAIKQDRVELKQNNYGGILN